MANEYGLPHLFITISPISFGQILVRYICGDIEKEAFLHPEGNNHKSLFSNAYGSAKYYNFIVEWFIKHCLKYDTHSKKATGLGLFGETKAFYGATEPQSTGNLHLHMVLWIKGLPTSSFDWKQNLQNSQFSDSLAKYVDSIKSCSYPEKQLQCPECSGQSFSNMIQAEHFMKNKASTAPPCILCLQCRTRFNFSHVPQTISKAHLNESMHNLKASDDNHGTMIGVLRAVQEHDPGHKSTCFRKSNDCHFTFPKSAQLQKTFIDKNGYIQIQRNYGSEYLNGYNKLLIQALKCNHDITLLLGSQALVACFYIMKYTVKAQQESHLNHNIFQLAIEKKLKTDQAKEKQTSALGIFFKQVI
jgi:hypothetical protein